MYVIRIKTGNAAFADAGPEHEIGRILRELAVKLAAAPERMSESIPLADYNGQAVGHAGEEN